VLEQAAVPSADAVRDAVRDAVLGIVGAHATA